VSVRTRQTAHTVALSFARIAVGGITTIVVARALGPQGRGAYAVLVTVASLAVVLGHLSIEPSHTSLWTRAGDRAAIATNSLLFGLVVGILAAVGAGLTVVALGPELVPIMSWGLLVVTLVGIPCNMMNLLLTSVLVLRQRIEVVNWSGLFAVSVHCLVLVLLTEMGHLTLGWVVVLWTVSTIAPLTIVIPSVRPRLRDHDLALARRALQMGLRYHIGNTSLFLLLRADILILNALSTTLAVGLYSVAVTLVELTRLTADSIAQVSLPQQMGADHDSAAAFTAKISRVNVLLTIGSVTLMCASAPILIPIVYGPAFAGSVAPLFGLAPGLIALGAARTISPFLLRLHRPLLISGVALIAMTVNVGLNLVLIPAWGVMGCAIASSVSYLVLVGVHVAWFTRVTRTPLRLLVPGPAEIRYMMTTWSRLTRPSRIG
jgi:O-antigen/teichoic acid export membrane protein